MVKDGGDFTVTLLQEGLRDLRKDCDPEEHKKAELATIVGAGMSEVKDVSRAEVLARIGSKPRYEGMSCRVRAKEENGPWLRGICRRYGVKTMQFIPFGEEGEGEVLDLSEFDIINDFDWALHRVGAQMHRTEQQLGRLRSDTKRLNDAYRRVLLSRTGGGRGSKKDPPKEVTKGEKRTT